MTPEPKRKSESDDEKLRKLLEELTEDPLEVTGYTEAELDAIVKELSQADVPVPLTDDEMQALDESIRRLLDDDD